MNTQHFSSEMSVLEALIGFYHAETAFFLSSEKDAHCSISIVGFEQKTYAVFSGDRIS